MDQNTLKKYTSGFSIELLNFITFIEELIPTETTQKIISHYDKLNTLKLMTRYHKLMAPQKDLIMKRNISLFAKPCFIIPEFDMSFFWDNLPSKNYNRVWETLSRLLIYCNLIIDTTPKQSVTQIQNSPINKPKQEFNPYDGVGDNNTTISVDTLMSEIESGKDNSDPIMSMLKNSVNGTEIAEQLKNFDTSKIPQMTSDVKDILISKIDNPKVSDFFGGIMNDIGTELGHADLSSGNIFDTMLAVAGKIAPQVAKNATANNFTQDDLKKAAASIMANCGLPTGTNPNDILSGNPAALLGLISGASSGGNPMDVIAKMFANNKK